MKEIRTKLDIYVEISNKEAEIPAIKEMIYNRICDILDESQDDYKLSYQIYEQEIQEV